MKSLTNVLISLALVFSAHQVIAQDTGTRNELQEVTAKPSVEESRYGYVAPNEAVNHTASGCWSDYLRDLYQQDAEAYRADMFATRIEE